MAGLDPAICDIPKIAGSSPAMTRRNVALGAL